jgi:hypothetical protein
MIGCIIVFCRPEYDIIFEPPPNNNYSFKCVIYLCAESKNRGPITESACIQIKSNKNEHYHKYKLKKTNTTTYGYLNWNVRF